MSSENTFYYGDIPFYYKDIIFGKLRYYLQKYWNSSYSISQITDHIYISDFATACNKSKLKEDGITHILCTILNVDPIYSDDFIYKNIHLRDINNENINQYFQECSEFIHDAIKNNGKVLIHCSYGISRSVSMVLAYLINQGMSYGDAYDLVKEKRSIMNPNKGFRKQLLVYYLERNLDISNNHYKLPINL